MNVQEVLKRPLLTEKSNYLQSNASIGYKKYSFEVDQRANKFQIQNAIKEIFKVEPLSCNIISVKGKKKRNLPVSKKTFKRGQGQTSSWKKAIVTLPKGKSIEALEALDVGET